MHIELSYDLIHGNALDELCKLPSDYVDCCITSPPYWALRDYKTDGQLGLEPTFQEYIAKLVAIFDEVKRVLKKTGTCWVVMGDTYAGHKGQMRNPGYSGDSTKGTQYRKDAMGERQEYWVEGAPEKSLCKIPQRFELVMIDRGWIERSDIIWYKPNCMPSSAKDRFTVDYEHVFFFVKSPKYYFETQYEPHKDPKDDIRRRIGDQQAYNKKAAYFGDHQLHNSKTKHEILAQAMLGRIKRCVWKIPTAPYKQAHFATFPPALVEPMIKAGCPVNGLVLDLFCGSGTVGLVAAKLARNFVGIEINGDYVEMAKKRLAPYLLQSRLQI